jgi:hypothetical protein
MVVELKRDPDDVIAFALQETGHNRRVDAARHGDDHAGLRGRARQIETVGHPETAQRASRIASQLLPGPKGPADARTIVPITASSSRQTPHKRWGGDKSYRFLVHRLALF